MPTDLFFVDTSAWIFVLRKEVIPALKDRVATLLKDNALLTAGIVKLELLGGTRTRKEFLRLKSRLAGLEEVATGEALWGAAFELAFSLRRQGVTVPFTDIVIAACAQSKDAALIHADAHFDLISKHTSLKVESYVGKITEATAG